MKTCSTCQITKPTSEFRVHNTCKVCARARSQRYYHANPQKYIEQSKAYRRDNLDKRKVSEKAYRLANPERAILAGAKSSAKGKNLPFDLDLSDIVIPDVCPVLGIVLDRFRTDRSKRPDNMPSIDRMIPALGYVKGNVFIISMRANRIKQNATSAELLGIADYIRDHNAAKKETI